MKKRMLLGDIRYFLFLLRTLMEMAGALDARGSRTALKLKLTV